MTKCTKSDVLFAVKVNTLKMIILPKGPTNKLRVAKKHIKRNHVGCRSRIQLGIVTSYIPSTFHQFFRTNE